MINKKRYSRCENPYHPTVMNRRSDCFVTFRSPSLPSAVQSGTGSLRWVVRKRRGLDPGEMPRETDELPKSTNRGHLITRNHQSGTVGESSTPPRRQSVTGVNPTEFIIGLYLTDIQYSLAHDDQSDTYELLVSDVAIESAATVQVTPGYQRILT
jgi:hypothetical protein